MKMGVEVDSVPECLNNRDDSGNQGFPGRDFEISVQGPESRPAEITQKPSIILEENPQHLGNREDDLPMRDIPKQPAPHPLPPDLNTLGLAGRAKSARFTGKHQQVLRPAGGTSNPCESTPRISTVEILLDDLFDDRTKEPELPLKAALVLRKESLEMMGKHAVENRPLRMPRTIDSRHGGINVSRIGPRSAGDPVLLWKYDFYPIPDSAIKTKSVNRS